MNPVEAKMVKNPNDYWWSSYIAFRSDSINPHIITTKILSHFPEPQKDSYRHFVEGEEKLASGVRPPLTKVYSIWIPVIYKKLKYYIKKAAFKLLLNNK